MRDNIIGMVATSKAGRDKGRTFVVLAVEGDEFVMISDGRLRKVASPKKKKLKHLLFGKERIDLSGMPAESGCADAFIRKALDILGNDHITVSEEV